MGLVWGLIEILLLTVAISPIYGPLTTHPIDANNFSSLFSLTYRDLNTFQRLVFIFGITSGFFVGLVQLNPFKAVRSLLISKLVAIPAFVGLLIYFSSPFPSLWDLSSPSANISSGEFLGMYIFVLVLVMVIGEVFTAPLGAIIGESTTAQGLARSTKLALTRLVQKRALRRVQPGTKN